MIFQALITIGITLISVATISFLFESKGWTNHLKSILVDLMTDPKFLLESYGINGVRVKIKRILKGGLDIDILGDEFFDSIDKNYINSLLKPIIQNYHIVINIKIEKIKDIEVITISEHRTYSVFNPTNDELDLFPLKRVLWSNYFVDKENKDYIRMVNDGDIKPIQIKSIRIDNDDLLDDSKYHLEESFEEEDDKNYFSQSLKMYCDKKIHPYKYIKKMKKIEYVNEYIFPVYSDYFMWNFKNMIKGVTVILNYPNKKLSVSSYVTSSSPDSKGHLAKKISGKPGEELIVSDEVYFPGDVLFVHWSPR